MSNENDPSMDTIKYGVELTKKRKKDNGLSKWKAKELGLQCVLFGLAEIQAKRVSKLAGAVQDIEDRVFTNEIIQELDPRKLLHLYQLSTESLSSASDYIRKTIGTMDWENMEMMMREMEGKQREEKGDEETIKKITAEVLRNFHENTNEEEHS